MRSSLKIFIIDDSLDVRFNLTQSLSERKGVVVAGSSGYGFGLERVIRNADPDVLVAELPTLHDKGGVMPGLTALSVLGLPVVLFSKYGEAIARDAVMKQASGGVGYVSKPKTDINYARASESIVRELHTAFQAVTGIDTSLEVFPEASPEIVVAIGSSTGGPEALATIVSQFPANFSAAIVIVQHMPGHFTGGFAERLNKLSLIPVKEVEEGDVIKVGQILLARGDYHLVFKPSSKGGIVYAKATLTLDPPQWKLRPTVDKMMVSLAHIYGSHMYGIILTGMGQDGSIGMREIKLLGGHTIVQNKETSAVYGMAREVVKRNLADQILPLARIVPELVHTIQGGK